MRDSWFETWAISYRTFFCFSPGCHSYTSGFVPRRSGVSAPSRSPSAWASLLRFEYCEMRHETIDCRNRRSRLPFTAFPLTINY